MPEENGGNRRRIFERKVSLRDVAWLIGLLVGLGMAVQRITDIGNRQHKYIERDAADFGAIRLEMEEARRREVERCIVLAVRLEASDLPCT